MEEAVPFSIVSTVKALSGALRRDADHEAEISREREKLWFKESSAKNLRNRDFLSPNTVLTTMYAGGEVSLKYVLTCAFLFSVLWSLPGLPQWQMCSRASPLGDFTHGLKRRVGYLKILLGRLVMNHRVTDTELSEC